MMVWKQAFAVLLLGLGLLAHPAAAVEPAIGNPTKADVLAEMQKVNKVRSGLGDDEGAPKVSSFALPSNIRVAGKAVGPDENGRCPGDGEFQTVYRDVQICLPVCTVGKNVTNALFPPGLIVTTASEGFQNGLLVEKTVLAVPPTTCTPQQASGGEETADEADKNVTWLKLSLFCLNESQNPSSSEGRYMIVGVTTDPDLLDLVQFLQTRDISTDKGSKIAQKAIYSITEKKGLTWQDRKDLYSLPKI